MKLTLFSALLGFFSYTAFAGNGDCEAFFTYTLGEGGYVEFENQSFWDSDNVEWFWSFGDSESSELMEPSFTFEPGTYTVCLTLNTSNCDSQHCQDITIPESCSGLEISLESIIDPATLIEITWLLENLEGVDLESGELEVILGGTNGEISLCLPDGCYSITLTGPEDFSFDILILLMQLQDIALEPLNLELDGNTLLVSFAINSDCGEGSGCPGEMWSGPTEICGCYAFEVGSAADSPQVSWYFGEDGPYVEGHFADYCFEENGTYTVTAIYSSETCPQETYTTEVVVDCPSCEIQVEYSQNDCGEGIYEAFGYPENAQLFWFVDTDNEAFATGVSTIEVDFETPGAHWICVGYETPECPQWVNWCTEFVVDDCTEPCELEVEIIEADDCSGEFVLEAYNFPEGANLIWTANGDSIDDDHFLEWTAPDEGTYQLCVGYETLDCPNGNFWCETFTVEACTSCPEEYGWGYTEYCGCVVMEIGSFVEGEVVSWDFGDGVDETSGHFTDHCYEENGTYTVIAIYNSPVCQNQTYTFEIVIDCYEEGGCPQDLGMSDGYYCGCYEFEIGSFVDGEAVTWDFGDGTTIEGGHYIEYCYETDGEYVVTAWYESSECEGMLYTLGVANVNCENECTEVGLGMDALSDGPSWVEWGIFDLYTEDEIEEGVCQYSLNDSYCDAGVCLPDGCYMFSVSSETAIGPDNFQTFIGSNSEGFNVISGPNQDGDYTIWWEFSINNDCDACPLIVEYEQNDCGHGVYEVTSAESDAIIWWTIDGESTQEPSNNLEVNLEPGAHSICAYYQTATCAEEWCVEFYIDDCDACPTDLWIDELDECGCFEFELGSFQEGESVDWYWGDGTESLNEGHYIQHCYDQPGVYVIEVVYTSTICPDGVNVLYTILFDCDDCTDVSFAFDSFADLGGSEYIEWALTNPDGEAIEEGSCEYVNGPYCDANLCLEDGCYEMDIWFPTPITSDDAFFSAAFIAGEQLPYAGQIIWIDDMHMTYFFGVNSDCGNAIEDVIQSQFEIYPVPASDVLTLNVSHDLVGARVIIYDAQGRSVIDAPMTGINKELSVNSLAQGLYTTVIQNDTVRIARKIQILR